MASRSADGNAARRPAEVTFTQGGFDEDVSARMVERFPENEVAVSVWEMLLHQGEPIGESLRGLAQAAAAR